MDMATGISLGAIVILTLMAVMMMMGKGTFLLNGLGFRSVEALERFDPVKMIRFIGCCLLGIDLAMGLALLSYKLQMEWLAVVAAAVVLLISIGATIYMKTGERFTK